MYANATNICCDLSADILGLNLEYNNITYLAYDPTITLWTASFYPTNENQVSTYTFSLSSEEPLDNGTSLVFIFPNNYDSTVIPYDKTVYCTSTTLSISNDCTNAVAYEVEIVILQNVVALYKFDITIIGVMNPNYATTGYVDIATRKNGVT
jgi:hypothetical protein